MEYTVKGLLKYRQKDGIYFLCCVKCGEEFGRRRISPQMRERGFICYECQEDEKRKKRNEEKSKIIEASKAYSEEEVITIDTMYKHQRNELKYERAIERLEKQNIFYDRNKEAFELIHKYIHKAGWFSSIEEIMTAVFLTTKGYKIIHQQKIAQYKVDFVIKDKKTIVEIDGNIYHADKEKEAMRDFVIKKILGMDWKILHVDTKYVNSNIKRLQAAIESNVMDYNKRLN